MKSSRAAEGATWKRSGNGGGISLASDSDDDDDDGDDDDIPGLTCASDSEDDDDDLGDVSEAPATRERSVGSSYAISAAMKIAVQQAIGELESAKFIGKSGCAFQLD